MRWISRLSAFAGGLVLALSVHFVWRWHQPLSLCDLDRNPDKYTGRIVRVRTFVSRDVVLGGPVVVDPMTTAGSVCSGSADIIDARVTLDAQEGALLKENRSFWRQEQENQKFYISDVILVGMFDPHDDGITHCWAPKYELVNSKIERIVTTNELTREKVVGFLKSNSH